MRQEPFEAILDAAHRVAQTIRAGPPGSDAHEADRADEVGMLHRAGLLAAPLGDETLPNAVVLKLLVRLGGADLSLARLYEGHVNAVQLVQLYGSPQQIARVEAAVREGALMGVWGADGKPAFSATEGPQGRLMLHGAKRYASGLGLVRLAIVPYHHGEGPMRLLLLDSADDTRCDDSAWKMLGMRATRSGRFDFEGLEVGEEAVLGVPGDYEREPYFVGGIWRCAAAQLGAIERIVELFAEGLTASGRLDHPLQTARLGEAIMEARTARLWIEDASARIGTESDVPLAVALSAFARLRTEAAGLAVIALAQRGIGLAAFSEDHPLERPVRDLSTYLRQANPDAALLSHTRALASDLSRLSR